jgi:hypothetical protein
LSRRGDLTTPVFLWFTGVAAALILVVWYAKSSAIFGGELTRIDEDLKEIHYDLALACTSARLEHDVIPHTTAGKLVVNSTHVCITQEMSQRRLHRCLPTPCDLGVDVTIDIGQTQSILINKTRTSMAITARAQ